jgi:hypothetical protein
MTGVGAGAGLEFFRPDWGVTEIGPIRRQVSAIADKCFMALLLTAANHQPLFSRNEKYGSLQKPKPHQQENGQTTCRCDAAARK